LFRNNVAIWHNDAVNLVTVEILVIDWPAGECFGDLFTVLGEIGVPPKLFRIRAAGVSNAMMDTAEFKDTLSRWHGLTTCNTSTCIFIGFHDIPPLMEKG
jgi:hypothetical protein